MSKERAAKIANSPGRLVARRQEEWFRRRQLPGRRPRPEEEGRSQGWRGQPWRLSTAPWRAGPLLEAGPRRAKHTRSRMKATVADHLLDRLRDWGVEHIFGYPGDGINGLLGAFFARRRPPPLRPIPARGDEWRSPRSGFALLRSSRRLHGHVGARRHPSAQRPVRRRSSTTCRWWRSSDRPTARHGGSYQQEVDLPNLFKDVASDYRCRPSPCPQQLPNVLDRALRTAMTQAGSDGRDHPQTTCRTSPTNRPAHEFKMVPSSLGISLAGAHPRRGSACSARPERPQRGLQSGRPGRPRARAGRPPNPRRRRPDWAPAWPRHCWAKTSSVRRCRG